LLCVRERERESDGEQVGGEDNTAEKGEEGDRHRQRIEGRQV